MQEKVKFYLFFVSITALLIVVLWMKKVYGPEYYYANRELVLDFHGKQPLSEERMSFVEFIVRGAQLSNYKILEERKILVKIEKQFQKQHDLSLTRKEQLEMLIKKYMVKVRAPINKEEEINHVLLELNKRVQIVPVRLALGQAIIESAWGTSRFSKQGNAYFGIHCYEQGCGMPFNSDGRKVFVKSYENIQASIEDYMLFLNSKKATGKFREAREAYLSSASHHIITLAESLTAYSEIGGAYHQILVALFEKNIPDHIDDN